MIHIKNLMAVLCALMMLLSLTACGAEAKPEATVSAFLDAMKVFDFEAMNACTTADQSFPLNINEADEDELPQQLLDVFKSLAAKTEYTIGETKVDGDNATVNVTLQYTDVAFLVNDITMDMKAKTIMTRYAEGGVDLKKLLRETLQEKIETSEIPQITMDLSFSLVKVGDDWRIQPVPDEVIDVLMRNTAKEISALGETLSDFIGAEIE